MIEHIKSGFVKIHAVDISLNDAPQSVRTDEVERMK